MTSAIPYTAIDETYPVAGVDNNSQGFRDNFSYIKTGLSTAASEITSLQQNRARIDTDNNFNGHMLENAVTKNLYPVIHTRLINTSEINIDTNDGMCQIFTVASDSILKLNTWPATNRYVNVRLIFKNSTSTSKEITFQVNASIIGRSIFKESGFPNPLSLESSEFNKHYIVDAWSYDAGETIYLRYVGEFTYAG